MPIGIDSRKRILEDAKDTVAEGMTAKFSFLVPDLGGVIGPRGSLPQKSEDSVKADNVNSFLASIMKQMRREEAFVPLQSTRGDALESGGDEATQSRPLAKTAPQSDPSDGFFKNLIGTVPSATPPIEEAKARESSVRESGTETVKQKLERLKAARRKKESGE